MNRHVDGNEQLEREFGDLIDEIRAVKPEPEEGFITRLDARADEGFPKPVPTKVARSGREDSMRRVLAPLVAGLAAVVLVVVGTSNLTDSFMGGGDSGEVAMEVATTEAMEEPVEESASEFFEGPTEAEPTDSGDIPVSGGAGLSADSGPEEARDADRGGRNRTEASGAEPESQSPPPAEVNYELFDGSEGDDQLDTGIHRMSERVQPLGGGEETTPPTAKPLSEALAAESRQRETQLLPIILIAAGVLLLIPALWFSTVNLRRRYRERVLDW